MERIEALLELLDNPQSALKSVHVAGTNGKGSTCWIIASILHKAGYRVGSFLSPHISSYRERLRINGEYITAQDMNDYLDRVMAAADRLISSGGEHPTEFEILTALAFLYFKDRQVDIAVLEVGMGGRYDSTNVITPLVSVITSIDYDHVAYLGDTLEEIAFNKAGIIKPGVSVVVSELPEPAHQVIESEAGEKRAHLYHSNSTVKVVRKGSPLDGMVEVALPGDILGILPFSLLGDYQLANLATALTAIYILQQQGWLISSAHIRDALAGLSFPGRLQVMCRNPLIIADAAHNPHACRALRRSIETLLPDKKRILLLGMLDDKDALLSIQELGPATRAAVVTRPDENRASNWRRLSSLYASLFPGVPIYEEEEPTRALDMALGILKDNEYMLISGSFYLLGKLWSSLAGRC
ncbi:MAG: folylpolyglutamate synthase/dihydrofolate synthase family protein [Syntrophomonas sp.]